MTTLETSRLLLRPWRADDEDAYARIFAKSEAMAFQQDRGLTPEEARDYLRFHIDTWNGRWGHWAVILKSTGIPIGWIGLEPTSRFPGSPSGVQIGWRLDPDEWHQGFATEGAVAVLDYARRGLQMKEVYVLLHPDNRRSARVAEKLGAAPLPTIASGSDGEPREVYVIRFGERAGIEN